jgi:hypothetical protein
MDEKERNEILTALTKVSDQLSAMADALPRVLVARDAMLEKELARKLDEALDVRDRALEKKFANMLGRDDDADWWKK